MKDLDRIERMLRLLEDVWAQHPAMRLGQLIYVVGCRLANDGDVFFATDERLEAELVKCRDSGVLCG